MACLFPVLQGFHRAVMTTIDLEWLQLKMLISKLLRYLSFVPFIQQTTVLPEASDCKHCHERHEPNEKMRDKVDRTGRLGQEIAGCIST